MGKQRSKEGMEKVRQRFVSGAADRGIDRATADRIIEGVAAEYKVQGLSSQYHPMQVLRQHISRDGTVNIVAQRFMALRQHCSHLSPSTESPDSQGTNVAETSSACRCHEHF